MNIRVHCTEIIVLIRYENNFNPALISNLQLVANEELIFDTEENESVLEENESSSYCVCDVKCAYGADCPCTCESEEECDCIVCNREKEIKTFDTFGNTCAIQSFDGIQRIESTSTYTANGNYLLSKTNEDNNTVLYNYDELNGILESITDAQKNTIDYNYNAYGLLISVSALNKNNLTGFIEYDYNNDKLTKISHNGFDYVLAYDLWGQLVSVSVDSQTIISYEYGSGKYRDRLKNVTY